MWHPIKKLMKERKTVLLRANPTRTPWEPGWNWSCMSDLGITGVRVAKQERNTPSSDWRGFQEQCNCVVLGQWRETNFCCCQGYCRQLFPELSLSAKDFKSPCRGGVSRLVGENFPKATFWNFPTHFLVYQCDHTLWGSKWVQICVVLSWLPLGTICVAKKLSRCEARLMSA